MKRLIVCFDGTWNTPEQEENGVPAPTNVFKIFNAIAESDSSDSREQKKYYNPGVGTKGGFIGSVLGGTIGVGISRNIKSAYHWLANNYEEGDKIFLYGFSRGAFAARSLGGLLGCGLLDLKDVGSEKSWKRVKRTYDKGYRKQQCNSKDWAKNEWQFFHNGRPVPIHFIGVWDTVGALGVPDDLEILNIFEKKKNWYFHNTEIGANVSTARHAMAIDEIRSSFSVTRWLDPNKKADLKELWFPGVHSDVGGGYADTALSNGALLWMIEESKKVGLVFREGVESTIVANPLGAMHNSYKGAFAKLRSRPRNIDALTTANANLFHPSALIRKKASPIGYPAYHPTHILELGESFTVEVYADTQWNYTGVYLEKGQRFTFSASGKWQDSKDTCNWEGTEDGKLTMGDMARLGGSLIGKIEDVAAKISKNESTDFWFTKRVEGFKWFALVGAITNDSGKKSATKNDGSPVLHQYVELAAHQSNLLKIECSGYLYCFPNDVWGLYGNNRGSLSLTIVRVV